MLRILVVCMGLVLTTVQYSACEKVELQKKYTVLFSDNKRPFAPTSIAFAHDGGLYAADASTGKIHRFDSAGNAIVSSSSGASGRLPGLEGIARSMSFALYAVDTEARRLLSFSDNLANAVSVTIDNSLRFANFRPFAITVSKNGIVYVTDMEEGEMVTVTSDGAITTFFKESVSGKRGKFKPVAVVARENILVADAATDKIVVFDRFGNSIRSFGDSLGVTKHGIAIVDSLLFVSSHRLKCLFGFTVDGIPFDTLFFVGDSADSFEPGALASERNKLAVVNNVDKSVSVFNVTILRANK